ncbi:TPA: hypothetical protein ACH74B_005022, partial [Escherichia coli]
KAPYRYASKTRLSIRRTDSGSAGCYVTVAVRGKQEFIIAELDSEIRKIRLKLTDSYEVQARLRFRPDSAGKYCRMTSGVSLLFWKKARMTGGTEVTDTSLTPSRCSVVQPRKREKASFPRFRRFCNKKQGHGGRRNQTGMWYYRGGCLSLSGSGKTQVPEMRRPHSLIH